MPPLPRFHNLSEEKRRRILDAAAAEFAEHGFQEASLNRLIARAGMSKGAMYYYFADKADVYSAVLDDVMQRVEAVVAEVERTQDAKGYFPMLEMALSRLNAQLFSDAQLASLFRGIYQAGPRDSGMSRILQYTQEWTLELLSWGQELGAIRRDVPLPLLGATVSGMLIAMDQWFTEQLSDQPPRQVLPLTATAFQLVRELVAAPPYRNP